MSGHRGGGTFKDFILISIVLATFHLIGLFFAILWRAYKKSLSLVSGRPLEHCQSLFLTPALGLGMVAWLLVLAGVLAVSAPAELSYNQPPVWQSVLTVLAGGGLLYLVRVIIRRGCL